MSRLIAIPDIHGDQDGLSKLLDTCVKTFKDYKLIFLGDYCDRGPDSAPVMRFVQEATTKGHIALLGNHEDMLLNFVDEGDPFWINPIVGGVQTLESFEAEAKYVFPQASELLHYLKKTGLYRWIKTLPTHYVEDGLVFTHGVPGKSWDGFLPVRKMSVWGHPDPVAKSNPKQSYIDWMWSPSGYFAVCGHSTVPPDADGVRRPLYVPGKGIYLDCGAPTHPLYGAVFEDGKLAYYLNSEGQLYKDANCTPTNIIL